MPSDSYIVKRALFISFVERYANTCLQFVSIMVLARLLTPEDIGIYTVGLAIIGIAHMVRDFGIGKYLVQEKELTKEKVSAALGLTICFAWTLGLIVCVLAPYAADFYKEESIKEVIYVVALNFLIIPFGAMAPALLKRSMSFGTILKINLASTFVSVVVGISLAYSGHGYMSMAWASVANVAASAIMAQCYLPAKYRVWPSLRNSKKILGFGSHVVGANLANELNSSALDLMVGKVLGFATLGFLSRGQGFVKIYDNVIQKATAPVISAHLAMKHRTGKELEKSYFYTVGYVTLVGWFSLGFMGLMSANLINLLYGDQWDAAVPIASFLCLLACIGIPNSLARNLLMATGNVKINFRLTLTFVVLRIVLIALFVHQGLDVLLSSFLVLICINLVVTNFIVFHKYEFQCLQFVQIIMKNLAINGLSLLVPAYFWVTPNSENTRLFSEVLMAGSASCLSWIVLIYLVKHPVRHEINNLLSHIAKRCQSPSLP
ncbi:lipopolysaccharide biosynthesis protein [Pseudomaricurvus alcaniphilus]|uniref:oligosaccharide flippase family protein n=1 Tax=Pseudomaricurvus alcaniphilus TaxID=1166482 RepID=UPI001408E1B5|nr:lipopolysaccharide biosynthesis protein [Pseudomaricurvus alcaniphilus]